LFLIAVLGISTHISARAADAATCTVTTQDLNLSTVQAAVNNAARGDVVCLPSGSVTWSGTLTITKGLTLQGAGYANTVITRGGTLISIAPDSTAIGNEEKIAVTGLTLDGAGTALVQILVQGASPSSSKPFKNLVIGENRIRNGATTTSNNGAISTLGQLRGVVYGNIFDRVNVVAKIMGSDDVLEWSSGAFRQSYGTADNLYFEDNTIQFSSPFGGSDAGWIESGHSGRVAMRYNTWNWANATPAEIWDIHGFQNWPGGQTGTMVVEYYGNTLMNAGGYRWINHRGGWGLFFNNILSGTGGNSIDEDQMGPGSTSGTGCNEDVPGDFNGEVSNTYVFNNTGNGVVRNMAPGPVGGTHCGVAENVNYFNYNSSCTASACAAGIGRGTSAPTGTCTVGVGFWVAPTATPTVDRSSIQSGELYKCIAPNVWAQYYTPLQYPHPLRAKGVAPMAPTSLSVR
jgi:hypothetical protein